MTNFKGSLSSLIFHFTTDAVIVPLFIINSDSDVYLA